MHTRYLASDAATVARGGGRKRRASCCRYFGSPPFSRKDDTAAAAANRITSRGKRGKEGSQKGRKEPAKRKELGVSRLSVHLDRMQDARPRGSGQTWNDASNELEASSEALCKPIYFILHYYTTARTRTYAPSILFDGVL